jgi:hypothetical protein
MNGRVPKRSAGALAIGAQIIGRRSPVRQPQAGLQGRMAQGGLRLLVRAAPRTPGRPPPAARENRTA